MADQFAYSRNFLRTFMERIKAASDIAKIKSDIKHINKEADNIEKELVKGDADILHKDYARIAKMIRDFRKHMHRYMMIGLSLENELIVHVIDNLQRSVEAQGGAKEPIEEIMKDVHVLVDTISEIDKDEEDLKSQVSDLDAKLKLQIESLKEAAQKR